MRPVLASCVILPLAVTAACSDDGPSHPSAGQATASTSAGSEGSGAEPTTGSATTHASATTSTTTASTTGEPPADSSTGGSSATTGKSTSTSSDTGEGTTETGPNAACAAGCAVEFMCGDEWAMEEDCVAWCEANLVEADRFSPYCRDAWEGVSACLATLTCEEFAQWQSPAMFPYPCSDADVVLEIECEGQ
ncbi:hypothetical protein [Paraliomyxa miuraensis]|uniref:hypothetical protein n=1 Tax=Paraliomyxa miuraensis TaxID=376150 RepID=UPI00225043FE|nr:hypothetical protein [Paraliomyxa miuraensis]MCX4243118.1 hypothetical protein [Paraliomyxa miuraensis]